MKYNVQELPQLGEIQKIFFVGIKGVGMAPLALIAKGAGLEVAGSDLADEFITDKFLNQSKVTIFSGFQTEDIKSFFAEIDKNKCLVITTGAHKGFDNPQSKWAKENKVVVLTQGQALGLFMEGLVIGKDHVRGVAIAGSHGKTTISSLLSTALKAAGFDPSYSVGTGELFPIGAPGYYGSGELFVAEADEYASEPTHDRIPKFLYQSPFYAVFNNIDYDHPDLFENIQQIEDAFLQFAHNIKSGGILFINGDDEKLLKLKSQLDKDIRVVTYGEGSQNDYVISKIVGFGLSSKFTVTKKGMDFGVYDINIPGKHNAKNSLSVIAFLSELGLDASNIRTVLEVFSGTKRRCEAVGLTSGGSMIIDDYGHHPLEISTTISAIKVAYPEKKLICVFQPHTVSRTISLLNDFAKSFAGTHKLMLLPIFKSARDTENDTLSTDTYVNSHKEFVDAEFFESFESVVKYAKQNYNSSEFIILTIGAGDVYKISEQLKSI